LKMIMPSPFPYRRTSYWKLPVIAILLTCVLVSACSRENRQQAAAADPNERTEPASAPAADMDENQRAFLWDIEHHGLLLSRYGFQPLADALSRGDLVALTALLAPEFKGQVLEQPREVRIQRAWLEVRRQEDSGKTSSGLGREAFCDRLLEYRRLFAKPPKVKFALMALAPVSRDKVDGLWQGTCQLRLWGAAVAASGALASSANPQVSPLAAAKEVGGPAEVVVYLRYQLPSPTEETLRQGGWLQSCAITQNQISRAPRFLLREATAERGLDSTLFHDSWTDGQRGSVTGGVYLCDYNRDGILDMLVVDVKRITLYQGLAGGKFKDVTLQVGLPWQLHDASGPNLVAAFVDLDGDGWEDLILDKRIFHNQGGQRFTDVSHRSNLRLPGDISGFAIADFDRDGRLDLYVARVGPGGASSWLDGKCAGKAGNLLLRNLGDWQFEDVTAASGAAGGDRSTFTAVWLDANNDGWPDLYVINEFGNGVLLINQGNGTFHEQALTHAPADFGSMGVTAGDIDNDGNIDLYVANMYSKAGNRVIGNLAPGTYSDEVTSVMRSFVTGSELWHNVGVDKQESEVRSQRSEVRGPESGGNPAFERRGRKLQVADVGWAYGPAMVDLDNDGWLDLYATAGFVSQDRKEPDG
jgi:hypothetical protein